MTVFLGSLIQDAIHYRMISRCVMLSRVQVVSNKRKKALGRWELLAIALGGMVGGGIFSILGVSVANIGNLTPLAIGIGGALALAAAHSYVQLAKLYRDEGATYSFFKLTFPGSPMGASLIGWIVTFGYISTLALYAFTFGAYMTSAFDVQNPVLATKVTAAGVLVLFAILNLVSVSGMGKSEDLMVYTKLLLLGLIAAVLIRSGDVSNMTPIFDHDLSWSMISMTAAITFVAFEGFQLAIHATEETVEPERDIPWAIYAAIATATVIYVLLAVAALMAIPKEELILNKESALAAGAAHAIGPSGRVMVILGAALATCSAISGTVFGASRLMAVIARDGFLPAFLSRRQKDHIPGNAIIVMTLTAVLMVIVGGLEELLEFSSITFIVVSLLMAYANFVKRKQTGTHAALAIAIMAFLAVGLIAILRYQWLFHPRALAITFGLYAALGIGSATFSLRHKDVA
ncbi:MAG: amino acid transporter [Planctomycetota bacterium]|jgi:amino acid transporter